MPAEGMVFDQSRAINFAALDSLIEWASQQADLVRLAVVEYLEEPDDEHLEAVLDLVDEKAPTSERKKEASLASLIERALPATMEELYVLGRRQHRSNRPEAAVRQTIRSLTRRGRVFEDERGRLCRTESGTAS